MTGRSGNLGAPCAVFQSQCRSLPASGLCGRGPPPTRADERTGDTDWAKGTRDVEEFFSGWRHLCLPARCGDAVDRLCRDRALEWLRRRHHVPGSRLGSLDAALGRCGNDSPFLPIAAAWGFVTAATAIVNRWWIGRRSGQLGRAAVNGSRGNGRSSPAGSFVRTASS